MFTNLLTYLAADQGFYKKYGVEVTIKPVTHGSDAIRAVQAGNLEATRGPSQVMMSGIAQGATLAAFEGFTVNDYFVGSTDPMIQTCKDLKGKTIFEDGTGGSGYIALQGMLKSCGLTLQDVTPVALSDTQANSAIVSGKVPTGVMEVDQEALVESQGAKVHPVVRLHDVKPDGMYSVYTALRSSLKENREAFVRFTAGLIEAARFFYDKKNTDAVAQTAAKFTHEDVPTARKAVVLYRQINMFPLDKRGLPEDAMMATLQEQVKEGNVPAEKAPTYDQMVDLGIWKDAMALVQQKAGS